MPHTYYRPFDETDVYTQDDADGLVFHKVLPEGIVPDVDMGMVTLTGPTHKWPGVHPWDQVLPDLLRPGLGALKWRAHSH